MAGSMDGLSALPNELLSHIFSYLVLPPPSISSLRDVPNEHLVSNPGLTNTPLKTTSLVNQRCRSSILPLLFEHVVWTLHAPATASEHGAVTEQSSAGRTLLQFLTTHHLAKSVRSLVLIVLGPSQDHQAFATYAGDYNGFWKEALRVIDPLRVTIVAPRNSLGLLLGQRSIRRDQELMKADWHILSLERPAVSSGSAHPSTAAPSSQASAATSTPREPHKALPSTLLESRPWTSLLLNEGSFVTFHTIDGSAYKYNSPTLLCQLLGASFLDTRPLIPATVKDLSYIAVSPAAIHFSKLVVNLPRIDRLYVQIAPPPTIHGRPWREALGLADGNDDDESPLGGPDGGRTRDEFRDPLWPPGSPHHHDQHHTGPAAMDESDLLRERNMAYGMLMGTLLDRRRARANDGWEALAAASQGGGGGGGSNGTASAARRAIDRKRRENWFHLKQFESGDTDDAEAWEMAVEYVQASGSGWTVARKGLFVHRPEEEVAQEDDMGPLYGMFADGDDDDDDLFNMGVMDEGLEYEQGPGELHGWGGSGGPG